MNHIKDIAKIIGVEFGDEFIFVVNDANVCADSVFMLTEKGLMERNIVEKSEWQHSDNFEYLFKFKIQLLKWIPALGDKYYTYSFFPQDEWRVLGTIWRNAPMDFARQSAGMVFQTRKEATKMLPTVRKRMMK